MPRINSSTVMLALAFLLCAAAADGHEVRPAYLSIEETAEQRFDVMWKQPIMGDRRLPLDPVLPDDCVTERERPPENTGAALILRWTVACDLTTGEIRLEGLTRTLTDVLVRVRYLDGETLSALLRPDAPTLDLTDTTPALAAYLRLGIEHLLFGIDHILFVIGLVLFIRAPWMLLKTITAFTVAHSITLALSVLEIVTLPQKPVEAVIALSILFLARELLLPESERSAIMRVRPWLMAFTFGLLHGFGFAGALADIGLPRDQLAWSLALFNIGIEVGQLMVIGVLLAAAFAFRRLRLAQAAGWQQAFTVVMGTMAAYWTLDRVWVVF